MLLVHRYEAPAHSRPPAAACPSSACFNVTGTARTLLTLVPYFVGTRSAACSGHLWLCSLLSCLPFLPLSHALTLLPRSSSLSPHLPYVPLPPPVFFSPFFPTSHTSSTLTKVEVVYDNHCLSVRSGPRCSSEFWCLQVLHVSVSPPWPWQSLAWVQGFWVGHLLSSLLL